MKVLHQLVEIFISHLESAYKMKLKCTFLYVVIFLTTCILKAQDCTQTSTSFIPIADLQYQTFEGYMGGKYPNGSNKIPYMHYKKGMQLSSEIGLINIDSKEEVQQSKPVFLVLGFSTAAMTGRYFRAMIAILQKNKSFQVIIGAQGGQDLNAMIHENNHYWNGVDSALQKNNFISNNVQIIWISTGDIQSYLLPFYEQCESQINKYQIVLKKIKSLYPNCKIVFLSDRTYAGYIGSESGPQQLKEPTAYYSSWVVKWLIEKQIQNQQGFTYQDIPFIDWGPLLWTNGEKGNSNGYTWNCDDAGKGGIHPSSKGRAKEATLMYVFFKSHPYTKHLFY